ncbi:MAG: PhzF family phenazine biosynthesis isomerase [Trebonia sp.]|jgi:PhzF family phenazine biosynthesis protein
MKIRIVDAFTDRPFAGNQAAVCVLPDGPWPPEHWLQAVAAEMNLSETAFVRPAPADKRHDWELRWFTPMTEVPLCGHATLAVAHVLASDGLAAGVARFATLGGVLSAEARPDGTIVMDFPANPPTPVNPADVSDTLAAALGAEPVRVYAVGELDRLLVELPDEKTVRGLIPDQGALARMPVRGVSVTALADRPGDGYDFVSRYFAPRIGIPEDPVTGSAHTTLAPFWSRRLGRTALTGLQVSARTGLVGTEVTGDRVLLTGRAVTVLVGELCS